MLREFTDDGTGQRGEVASGGVVLCAGQACGVFPVRGQHAKALRVQVHEFCKTLFVAGYCFCQRYRSVIATLNDHALDEVLDPHLHAGLHEHTRTFLLPSRR